MKIKILGDKEKFLAPTKGTSRSAAYDLYVQEDVIINNGRNIVPTGFAIGLDSGTAAEIRSRSGFSAKGMEGYKVAEAPSGYWHTERDCNENYERFVSVTPARFDADVLFGLIDEDYTDEVGVIIKNNGCPFLIKRGTRIAQMLILNIPETTMDFVDELETTERQGGFGSTGV